MNHKFTPKTRMFDILTNDSALISSVSRFGISLGFGDKTVDEVCKIHNIDTATFLSVINFLAEGKLEVGENSPKISLETVISYLKSAHHYFLSLKLPLIRTKLLNAIEESGDNQSYKVVLLQFFDEYVGEVKKHMEYEDRIVFPYVLNLLQGKENKKYKIADFEEHHTDVDSKLAELKNILIKYHPGHSVNYQLNEVLFDLLHCEKDLETHNIVEDYFFVPYVESIERTFSKSN